MSAVVKLANLGFKCRVMSDLLTRSLPVSLPSFQAGLHGLLASVLMIQTSWRNDHWK